MATYGDSMVNNGLDGIVAATTRLSHVDGERGELVIAGYPVGELAEHATFEETTWLLWHGELPSAERLRRISLRNSRPHAHSRRRRSICSANVRASISSRWTPFASRRARSRCARTSRPQSWPAFPTMVAAYWRLQRGMAPIDPRPDLGHAATFLYMLSGTVPEPERVRGLETYLNTVVDHGLNASTFTARVITSTGSDLVSAVVGALGALKGPLHGGAPGPALDMVFEIGEASRAEAILRAKIEAGEKLMGFGHRVYKVRDPRADVLAKAAERMYTRAGDMSLYTLARSVEATAHPPARGVQAGTSPADKRRVLHRAAAARPRTRRVAVHADVCDQPRERMDRARRSNSAGRTASSVHSRSTSVRATAGGFRSRNGSRFEQRA